MIKTIEFKGIPDMTEAGKAEYQVHLLKMGKKTKKDFTHALHVELHGRVKNSILNAGDIVRVADKYLVK